MAWRMRIAPHCPAKGECEWPTRIYHSRSQKCGGPRKEERHRMDDCHEGTAFFFGFWMVQDGPWGSMVSVCGLLGFLGLERMTYRYPLVDFLFLPFRTQHGFGVKRQEKTAFFPMFLHFSNFWISEKNCQKRNGAVAKMAQNGAETAQISGRKLETIE